MKVILRIATLFIFIATSILYAQEKSIKNSKSNLLSGPYFGQKPPGLKAELFHSGTLVTSKRRAKRDFNLAFSPKGDELFFSYYKGTEDKPDPAYEILTYKQKDGVWIGPETASFSGYHSDVDINFSPDGNYIFFASSRPDPTFDGLMIFFSQKVGDNWTNPVKADGEVNSDSGEVLPSLSEKGNFFFRSDRAGGYGGSDLYRAKFNDGHFTEVKNLGPNVNSEFGQTDPAIAKDESYVVFVSRRPGMNNVISIYVSFQIGDNDWTPAVPLGSEVNSEFGAGAPTISPDGKYLFFKKRTGDVRGIYWISTLYIEKLRSPAQK